MKYVNYLLAAILFFSFAVIIFWHLMLIDDYISFQDTSWIYALSSQMHQGKLLYKDLVWSVGPFPVLIEYFFQAFKPGFSTSIMIGLTIKILIGGFWFDVLRKKIGWLWSSLVVFFLMTQPNAIYFANWSTSWENLSIAMLIWAISNCKEGAQRLFVPLSLFLLLMSRQSSFALVATFYYFYYFFIYFNKAHFDKSFVAISERNIINISRILFLMLIISFLIMDYYGVLFSYIDEVFISAAEKKGVTFFHGLIDAISGGGAYLSSLSFSAKDVLRVNLIPFSVVISIFYISKKFNSLNSQLTYFIFLLFLFCSLSALVGFDVSSNYLDLPKIFVIISTVIIIKRAFLENNFSADYSILLLVNIIGLGSVFSYELSHPGRGWGNYTNIIPIAFLNLILISKRPFKNLIILSLACLMTFFSLSNLYHSYKKRINPFVEGYKTDYISGANRTYYYDKSVGLIKMPNEKISFIEAIKKHHIENKSCFVYATEPILYDIFQCNNPTAVFIVIGDFVSSQAAKKASEVLQSNPPCFLIVRKNWLAPFDEMPPDPTLKKYESMGKEAQFYLHSAMYNIIKDYDLVFDFKNEIGISDPMKPFYNGDWEGLSTHKVYKNKTCN